MLHMFWRKEDQEHRLAFWLENRMQGESIWGSVLVMWWSRRSAIFIMM